MTEEELLKQAEYSFTEDDCGICKIHELGYKHLPDGYECPHCNEVTTFDSLSYNTEEIVVGETNFHDPRNKITKALSVKCNCGSYFALLPEPIQYNGNHDIYYTGGRNYIVDGEDVTGSIEETIKSSVDNFVERVKKGEDLTAWHLSLWTSRDIGHKVTEYLYNKGLKR